MNKYWIPLLAEPTIVIPIGMDCSHTHFYHMSDMTNHFQAMIDSGDVALENRIYKITSTLVVPILGIIE